MVRERPSVTVAIPTLAAGEKLVECLASLERQTWRDFDVVVIDNSGQGLAVDLARERTGRAKVIENSANVGFGAAVNQAYRASSAAYLATLNDDALANPRWLEALVMAAEARPDVGMCASCVRLFGQDVLDSAGMLVCRDGSSKQRAHLQPASVFRYAEEVLMPSGSAALYRRTMLERIGLFDEDFFLYCEDTDLGLRARWAGWHCLYVPEAEVEHHYSHSAGRASPLKAYYVERNRLFVAVKNFPLKVLWAVPFVALTRYMWHAVFMLRGRGAAARFRQEQASALPLAWMVVRAHFALLRSMPSLLRKRRQIRASARIVPRVFLRLMRVHGISARRVAAL